MATYIVNETKNTAGELVVHVYVHSACCKAHLFFIEDKPGHFVDAETRMSIEEGMMQTIKDCRRTGMYWK